MNTEEIKNFFSFLKDAEKLKSVTRHSWLTTGRHESVPEHVWRMSLMAVVLGKYFPEINLARVLEMIQVHDLGEVYDGDVPGFEKKQDEADKERNAMRRVVKDLPSDTQEHMLELWEEYAAYETPEAKFAKSLDKLEATVQHNESDISTWVEQEYDFQFTAGKKYTGFHEVTKALQKAVDEITTQKIKDK